MIGTWDVLKKMKPLVIACHILLRTSDQIKDQVANSKQNKMERFLLRQIYF